MKKIVFAVLILSLMLMLSGCQRAMYTEEDYIAQARRVSSVAEAETIEMTYVGRTVEDGKVLVWVMSGNEHQAHRYLPMSCRVAKDGGLVFEHAYEPIERGTDILVLPEWQGGYAFCVNNPECKVIRIEDAAGAKEIGVTEYPFIHYNRLLPGEYVFLDENGNEIN